MIQREKVARPSLFGSVVLGVGFVLLTILTFGSMSGTVVRGEGAAPDDVDLVLTATVSAQTVTLGIPITYIVQIRNLGPQSADRTLYTQTLSGPPAQLSFQSNRGGGTCVNDKGNITCNFGRVSTLARITTTLHVIPTTTGNYSITTLVSSSITDSRPINNMGGARVAVIDAPIVMLNATSSSPTILGDLTMFSATVKSGSNISYTWDLGDGSPAKFGQTISHRYAAEGNYRASVTALNPHGQQKVSVDVLVEKKASPVRELFLPTLSR